MNVCIVVRSSMTTDKFRAQMDEPYKPKTELGVILHNDILELWKGTFKMDYFKYRARLAAISADNLRATGCRVLRGYEDYCRWLKYEEEDDDAVAVPVDDDDWFAPNLSELANHFRPGVKAVRWRGTTLHSITKMHFGIVPPGFSLGSNNWGVRKSYLKSLDPKQARHLMLLSHKHAEGFLKNNLPKPERQVIDEPFSVYNRHVGSLHFIRQKFGELDLHTELPKIRERGVTYAEPPEDTAWAEQYVKRLYILLMNLRDPVVPLC